MIVISVDTLTELKKMKELLDFASISMVEYKDFFDSDEGVVKFDVDIDVAKQAKEEGLC